MRTDLTPWSRGALGADKLERVRLHLTDALLHVSGKSPSGPWTVRITRTGREPFAQYGVGSARLWDVIVAGMAGLGIPLPSDEDWASLQAEIGALD